MYLIYHPFYAKVFLFESILIFADRYFYVNPKTHSPRYYKETDSNYYARKTHSPRYYKETYNNYYARIRKENSKHVHQEPYSLERIISGMYFVHLISLCENKVF